MGIVNGWNENQRGECESSKMDIIKRESSIVGGMLIVNGDCEKMACLTPPWRLHVLLYKFPKVYTKLMNNHMFPAGEWGVGERSPSRMSSKLFKNDCHPGLSFVYSPYVLGNITGNDFGNSNIV